MKRRVFVLLLAVQFGISACGNDLTPAQLTMAVQTLTATALPPTATSTPDPDESAIVLSLNQGLTETADPLSQTIDARYQVVDASFPVGEGGQLSVFQINVRCECSRASCCTPERAFLAVTNALKFSANQVIRQIPRSVAEARVICFDHDAQIGISSLAWSDWLDYLRGTINGFQLGSRVVTFGAP